MITKANCPLTKRPPLVMVLVCMYCNGTHMPKVR